MGSTTRTSVVSFAAATSARTTASRSAAAQPVQGTTTDNARKSTTAQPVQGTITSTANRPTAIRPVRGTIVIVISMAEFATTTSLRKPNERATRTANAGTAAIQPKSNATAGSMV